MHTLYSVIDETRCRAWRRVSEATRAQVLSSIVELLAGKAIPGKAKSFSSDKSRAAEQLVAHYEAVLLFLQRHGALVSSVSPEALLAPEAADLLADMREARASSAAELEALQQRYVAYWPFRELSLPPLCELDFGGVGAGRRRGRRRTAT